MVRTKGFIFFARVADYFTPEYSRSGAENLGIPCRYGILSKRDSNKMCTPWTDCRGFDTELKATRLGCTGTG
jgi:hypothetical protein